MRKSSTFIRWAAPAGAAALAVVLAACGSNDDGSSASSGSGSGSGPSGSAVVSTSDISGIGTVLVDNAGKTLYFTDEETSSNLKCTDACLDFWTPAQASGSLPSDIQGLDTITRSDNGEKQLALDGSPLYTFTLDHSAGDANGNDFEDTFDGTTFTWHAATTDQSSSSNTGGSSGSSGSGGYGSSGSDNGGNSNPYSY